MTSDKAAFPSLRLRCAGLTLNSVDWNISRRLKAYIVTSIQTITRTFCVYGARFLIAYLEIKVKDCQLGY